MFTLLLLTFTIMDRLVQTLLLITRRTLTRIGAQGCRALRAKDVTKWLQPKTQLGARFQESSCYCVSWRTVRRTPCSCTCLPAGPGAPGKREDVHAAGWLRDAIRQSTLRWNADAWGK